MDSRTVYMLKRRGRNRYLPVTDEPLKGLSSFLFSGASVSVSLPMSTRLCLLYNKNEQVEMEEGSVRRAAKHR